MSNEIMGAIVAVVLTFVITFLITWGVNKTKIYDLERRVMHAERTLSTVSSSVITTREEFSNQVHNLKDTYIGHQHFNQVMDSVRENYRDLKGDVNKILDLLNSRH